MRWQEQALCAGDLEFEQYQDLAFATCGRCPVRAECYAEARDDKHFEGIAGGRLWRPRKAGGVAHPQFYDWTEDTRREAHSNYASGQRTPWVIEGERAYHAERKRLKRAAEKAERVAA
jgi:hypothetical protein